MRTSWRRIETVPILGRPVFIVRRARIAARHQWAVFAKTTRWLLSSREDTNFTYDLAPENKKYLASLIAGILGRDTRDILAYIEEIETDVQLLKHVETATAQSPQKLRSDARAWFGRRIGWYAIARALKPKVIVETGVDKGLGSCVLASALMRNGREGNAGAYFGTDINPQAGYLFTEPYAKYGSILYGDSIESLGKLAEPIDLFINDSDHSADYEAREYEVVREKLSPRAIVLGDNAHVTDKLWLFSEHNGRDFVFFQEKPVNHWYPGGGIGISYVRTVAGYRE